MEVCFKILRNTSNGLPLLMCNSPNIQVTITRSPPPSPPWYVQYAPELAVASILTSLGVLMYLSPRFREAVKGAFLFLIRKKLWLKILDAITS